MHDISVHPDQLYLRRTISTFINSQMATHSDGILVSASGVNTPHEANGYVVNKLVKSLPADFYTDFLSNAARERKPSPSMFL